MQAVEMNIQRVKPAKKYVAKRSLEPTLSVRIWQNTSFVIENLKFLSQFFPHVLPSGRFCANCKIGTLVHPTPRERKASESITQNRQIDIPDHRPPYYGTLIQ